MARTTALYLALAAILVMARDGVAVLDHWLRIANTLLVGLLVVTSLLALVAFRIVSWPWLERRVIRPLQRAYRAGRIAAAKRRGAGAAGAIGDGAPGSSADAAIQATGSAPVATQESVRRRRRVLPADLIAAAALSGMLAALSPSAARADDSSIDACAKIQLLSEHNYDCVLCQFVWLVQDFATKFARETHAALAAVVPDLLATVLLLLIVTAAARLFLSPRDAAPIARDLILRLLLGCVIFAILLAAAGSSSDGDPPFLFEFVIDLLQGTAVDVARLVISVPFQKLGVQPVVAAVRPELTGPYVELWQNVEAVPMTLVLVAGERMDSFISAVVSSSWIPWFLLAIPYLFVLGVFAAFIVTTIFYFTAIAATSPLLLVGLLFPATRGLAVGGLRLCLTGALTVVFASAAMGLTGYVLASFLPELARLVDCAQPVQPWLPWPFSFVIGGSASVGLFGRASYWFTLVLGFASMILHLAAPRMAANLSGASDSAASAAAVVAAGQYLTARSIGALRRGAVGSPEMTGQLGGLAGAGVNLIMNRFRGARGS